MASAFKKHFRKRMRHSPSGQACVFVAINDKKGIKFYRTEHDRDENRDLQRRIFEETGFACEVFEDFDAAGYYGFVTERAQPIKDGPTLAQKDKAREDDWYADEIWEGIENASDLCHDSDSWDDSDESESDDDYSSERRRLYQEIKDVINAIGNQTGIWIRDTHTANMGYVRGMLVPIDFDHAYVP